jgi:deazaflavin-dependent oxidoreductase (nitroreductase family)
MDGDRRGANWVQRMMQRMASLRPVASVFRHTFHHLDKVMYRLLGRRTVSAIIAGVPNIMVTTTGAKTGRQRTVPVVGVPVDGGIAVIGTRWGSRTAPGWSYNLDHDPHAVIERNGERTPVVARRVPEGPEYEAIFRAAERAYLGFPKYRRRIKHRQVPIFVLEPEQRLGHESARPPAGERDQRVG